MLREEDLRFDRGRASHGGDFMHLTHVPTGLSRSHPGPLQGLDRQSLVEAWLGEIGAELRSKGLSQHVVPAYRARNTRQRRRGG